MVERPIVMMSRNWMNIRHCISLVLLSQSLLLNVEEVVVSTGATPAYKSGSNYMYGELINRHVGANYM